ncbi:MAG: ParA family protein [Melioribacteraceae bacterium]|nr:ParA family protein [Melioribacteraceae bacterium]
MEQLVISVAAPKGGVGKTTTAVNIATGLALKKKKTLLIDVDPSGYCSSAFGYDEHKIFGNIIDLYNHSKQIQEVIHKTELSFLEIIPSAKIGYKDEVLFNNLTVDKKVLRSALEEIKPQYDYIILDCPPFLYGSTVNSLIASDYLIMPVKSSKFSLEAVHKMIQFVDEIKKSENPKLRVDGLLLTMHENNTKASFQLKKELYRLYPNLMFKTAIPKNTSVAESTFYNKPVMLFDENALASVAYAKFVDELIEKHETTNLMKLSGFQNHDFLEEEKINDDHN